LIEAYIAENGKDPVTNEELTVDDLITVKTSRIVRPRPPTHTSIPSLLSTFQNEWDALALESYNVRQQLAQTRQELATALYQHDAAVRVIARLTRERDEARDALSKVTISAGSASNGDKMQVDSMGLPEELAEKVDATQEKYEAIFTNLDFVITDAFLDYPGAAENVRYPKIGRLRKTSNRTMLFLLRSYYILAALRSLLMSQEDGLSLAAQMAMRAYTRCLIIKYWQCSRLEVV
jgi:hypothetical protein